MKGIEIKTSPAELFARILCGALAVFVIFLLIFSLIFSFGNDAPSIFGSNVYVVKTDAFDIIKKGAAVIAKEVPYGDILAGNIVIYLNENDKAALAEVHSSEIKDGVYGFTAVNELGEDLRLSEGKILGKAMSSSPFLGTIIRFAKSPAGVMLIAVIPCFTVLGYEVFRIIISKLKGGTAITPVKKQDEVPTFVPRPKVDKALSAYKSVQNEKKSPENKSDNILDEYTEPEPKQKPNKLNSEDIFYNPLPKRNSVPNSNYPLYKAPQKSVPPPPPAPPPKKKMPLSQKRLNEIIAETKAKQAPTAAPAKNTASQNTMELNRTTRTIINNAASLNENLKQYTPRKQAASNRLSATQGIPRLDELLKDDSEHDNSGYDIENILNSFDKNKTE